jgi:hypothetical protein
MIYPRGNQEGVILPKGSDRCPGLRQKRKFEFFTVRVQPTAGGKGISQCAASL